MDRYELIYSPCGGLSDLSPHLIASEKLVFLGVKCGVTVPAETWKVGSLLCVPTSNLRKRASGSWKELLFLVIDKQLRSGTTISRM